MIIENKNLAEIFNLVLGSFNSINHSNQSGLIFAFLYSDNKDIFHFNSIDSFKRLIQLKKGWCIKKYAGVIKEG